MRALFTILTLGAGGVGYAYLQQASPDGEPYLSQPTASRSFDWNLIATAKHRDTQIPVKELVNRIHERTRSALDDFADRYSGHSDAPSDDAFQRLRQVTQSAVFAASNSSDSSGIDGHAHGSSRVPMPNSDELQRTAFDLAAEETQLKKPANPEPSTTVADKSTDASRKALKAESDLVKQTLPAVTAAENRTAKKESAEKISSDEAAERPLENVSIQPKVKRVSDRSTKSVDAKWKVVGKTTEGRPMHTMKLGDSGTRTFVIAGLNGDDPTAVRWLEMMTDELRRNSDLLENNEIIFFRAGNPDGLVRNKSNNSRGVPINRNFPGRRFRNNSDQPQFAAPASEVETRVILDTLYSFRPRRVIHLTATSGSPQVLFNRSAKGLATDFEQATKLPIRQFNAEQFAGSIEDFSDGTLEAAVLSMRLSVEDDWQNAWKKIQSQVVGVVTGKVAAVAVQKPNVEQDPDRSVIPPSNEEAPRRTPRRRGYEELPPPPKFDSSRGDSAK